MLILPDLPLTLFRHILQRHEKPVSTSLSSYIAQQYLHFPLVSKLNSLYVVLQVGELHNFRFLLKNCFRQLFAFEALFKEILLLVFKLLLPLSNLSLVPIFQPFKLCCNFFELPFFTPNDILKCIYTTCSSRNFFLLFQDMSQNIHELGLAKLTNSCFNSSCCCKVSPKSLWVVSRSALNRSEHPP